MNTTVQSASYMGPTPMRVLAKDGMMYIVVVIYAANCRIVSVAVSDDLSTCPIAVPTLICGALVLVGPCGDVGAM